LVTVPAVSCCEPAWEFSVPRAINTQERRIRSDWSVHCVAAHPFTRMRCF